MFILVMIHFLIIMAIQTTQAQFSDKPIGSRVLSLSGKVVLHRMPLEVRDVRAIVLIVFNFNPVHVQIWRQENTSYFTLQWQREINVLELQPGGAANNAFLGQLVINLDEEETLTNLTSSHHVGLYSNRDPNPVVFAVISKPYSLLSLDKFTNGPPSIGATYKFEDLVFPFVFSVTLCNQTDCRVVPLTTTTPNTEPTPQVQVSTEPSTTVAATSNTSEDSLFLSETFLLAVFIWLIFITFLLLVTIILLFIFKNRRNIANQDPNDAGGTDPSDFIVTIDEPRQAGDALSSTPSGDSFQPGTSKSVFPG